MQASPGLFLGLALVLIAVPYLIWRLPAVRAALPLVVVQILLGIALGPSLVGRIWPESQALVQAPVLATLSGIACLAVVLFAFLTGLHFDTAEIAGRRRSFLLVALSSVAVPAVLGLAAGAALLVHDPALAGPVGGPVLFASGVAVGCAVTALPVLGAILRETGLLSSRLGRDALGCAAINDLLLWVLLAAVLAMAQPEPGGSLVRRVGLFALYLLAMVTMVKPLVARLLREVARTQVCREIDLVLAAALALASAFITEHLGFHYVLGGFIAGAIVPASCARPLIRLVESFTVVILLPFFFMLTGLRTIITFDDDSFLLVFAGTAAAALFGKMAGTIVPARSVGESWSYSLRLGTLMQCKGLMDVVVLSVLFEAGILSQVVFSAMVVMAVATTAATKPMLMLCERAQARRAARAAGERS